MEQNIRDIYDRPGSVFRGKNGLFYVTDHQDTELIISAAHGDHERMKKVLASGCNINQQNSLGLSAITAASKMGSIECVKILLDNNADANIPTIDGNTPLILTAWYSCYSPGIALTVLKMLIAAGAHLDIKNRHGISALYNAIKSDVPELVTELLSAGANVDIKDYINGQTPVMLAAQSAAIRSLNAVFDFGPNINHKDFNGDTALNLAVAFNSCCANCENVLTQIDNAVHAVQCVKKLIDNGIDVNASNKKQETALFHLSSQKATQYTVTMLIMLLRAGIEINKIAPHSDLNCINACYKNNHLRYDTDDYFHFLRLLFVCGENCNVVRENVVNKALKSTNAQLISNGSLFHLCRTEIRSIIVQRHRVNLFASVPKLHLPRSIANFLLYDESL